MRDGLTFNDVLLVPKRTPLSSRSEAELKTLFTKDIRLNVPLVSSNMATVTEHKMAIAMARSGGLGVIHQFGAMEEQVKEVKLVKRSTSYVIEEPVSISLTASIGEAVHLMEETGVTSLLVVEPGVEEDEGKSKKLWGIFTSRDYLFETDMSRRITEVMTPRERIVTGSPGISLDEAKAILHTHRIEKLPLVNEQNIICGLITTKDIKKLEYWPQASRDAKGRLLVGAAIGVKDALERAAVLVAAGADCLVLDIAHAHSDFVIQRVQQIKKLFPKINLMVGNIATKEAALDLCVAGVDGLKVGIGPSPVCTTRIIAGAGVPQLTAIMDVVEAAKHYGVPVTADGGMKYPGDVAKALAAGASTVYSGLLFAGTDEAPGMIIIKEGKRYKKYHGSASYESSHLRQEKSFGRQYKERLDVFVEGVSILVDYKGRVEDVIRSLLRGVQSAMSYCGAHTIEEMQVNAEFIKITSAGWEESMSRGQKTQE